MLRKADIAAARTGFSIKSTLSPSRHIRPGARAIMVLLFKDIGIMPPFIDWEITGRRLENFPYIYLHREKRIFGS
jgi:hypothetical protein